MKFKRTAAACMALTLLCAALTGCSLNDLFGKKTKTGYEDYVDLGQYLGIEVEKETAEVTDAEIEAEIQKLLVSKADYAEVDGPAEKSDSLNIDFIGKYADTLEPFDRGSAEDQDLVIGSNTFINGFEDGLIGAMKGQTLDIALTFPEDYKNADGSINEMAGVDVVFNVQVNSITREYVPELTDTFIVENTDYETVEEYRLALYNELLAAARDTVAQNKRNNVWAAILDNCTVHDYPADELKVIEDGFTEYYTAMAANYGYELDTFLAVYYNGMTREVFNETIIEMSKTNMTSLMVSKLIAAQEGIEISEEEYQQGLLEYYLDANAETAEQFESLYGYNFEEEYGRDTIIGDMLLDKIIEFVAEKSVEV